MTASLTLLPSLQACTIQQTLLCLRLALTFNSFGLRVLRTLLILSATPTPLSHEGSNSFNGDIKVDAIHQQIAILRVTFVGTEFQCMGGMSAADAFIRTPTHNNFLSVGITPLIRSPSSGSSFGHSLTTSRAQNRSLSAAGDLVEQTRRISRARNRNVKDQLGEFSLEDASETDDL